jgi:hypothetical protein
MIMKVAIVGSRTFINYNLFTNTMDKLSDSGLFEVTEIISGGAKGVDTLAERYANEKGIPITVIKPDWELHGKSAGMIRNGEIIRQTEMVVAFWDGKSRGTRNTIGRAMQAQMTCFIINTNRLS